MAQDYWHTITAAVGIVLTPVSLRLEARPTEPFEVPCGVPGASTETCVVSALAMLGNGDFFLPHRAQLQ